MSGAPLLFPITMKEFGSMRRRKIITSRQISTPYLEDVLFPICIIIHPQFSKISEDKDVSRRQCPMKSHECYEIHIESDKISCNPTKSSKSEGPGPR